MKCSGSARQIITELELGNKRKLELELVHLEFELGSNAKLVQAFFELKLVVLEQARFELNQKKKLILSSSLKKARFFINQKSTKLAQNISEVNNQKSTKFT